MRATATLTETPRYHGLRAEKKGAATRLKSRDPAWARHTRAPRSAEIAEPAYWIVRRWQSWANAAAP